MTQLTFMILLLSILLSSHSFASADNFLLGSFEEKLDGWWDEGKSTNTDLFCKPGRNLHKHIISKNGKTIKWVFQQPYKRRTEEVVKGYSYKIIGVDDNKIILSMIGEKRTANKGKKYIWELVFTQEGMYRWRATHWPPSKYANIVGVLCKKPGQ